MKCSHCGSKRRLIKNTKYKNIQYYLCNKCNTAKLKKYRKTEKGKMATRKAVAKYESKNRKRKNSWGVGQYHNKKKKPCVVCGKSPTHRHHPDVDYPKAVIFLCAYHHKQAHKVLDGML